MKKLDFLTWERVGEMGKLKKGVVKYEKIKKIKNYIEYFQLF